VHDSRSPKPTVPAPLADDALDTAVLRQVSGAKRTDVAGVLDGIDANRFELRTRLQHLVGQGLLEVDGTHINLTARGRTVLRAGAGDST
jgi:hypothetical protein